MVKTGKKCQYTCEILDGGTEPLFRVTCSDESEPIIQNSSTSCWNIIINKINEISPEKMRTSFSVSGPEKYGLTEPIVYKLIQQLPNAEKCVKYKMK